MSKYFKRALVFSMLSSFLILCVVNIIYLIIPLPFLLRMVIAVIIGWLCGKYWAGWAIRKEEEDDEDYDIDDDFNSKT